MPPNRIMASIQEAGCVLLPYLTATRHLRARLAAGAAQTAGDALNWERIGGGPHAALAVPD